MRNKKLIALLLCLPLIQQVFAFGFQGSQPSFHTGWVLARSVVRDKDGKVQWSAYDAAGKQTPLQAGTRSVYVRSKKQWYTPDSRMVLFESPLDKTEMKSGQSLDEADSALLDKDGILI